MSKINFVFAISLSVAACLKGLCFASDMKEDRDVSFFNAPIPSINRSVFSIEPRIIGKMLERPSRPIVRYNRVDINLDSYNEDDNYNNRFFVK